MAKNKSKTLKKILSILATIVIIAAVVIFERFNPQPADCYNLETVLAADFLRAVAAAKEGETPIFYEAETVLNGPVTNDVVKIIEVTTIVQLGDRCMMIKHAEGSYTNAPEINIVDPGHWSGCYEIPMKTAPVTFDKAVEKLKGWDGIIPPANKMTFRRPQGVTHGHTWENGQYIFGTINAGGFVAVDSVTGAVEELEDGKETPPPPSEIDHNAPDVPTAAE